MTSCFRCAILGFACILLVNIVPGVAQSVDHSLSPDIVRLTVTVTDADGKKPISGLPQAAFNISDDVGVRQPVSFNNEDVPLSIAILLDLSGSIGDAPNQDKNSIKLIAEALSNFVQQSNPLNEYFIIVFAKTTYALADGARNVETVLSALQKLTSAEAHGNTALYDACRFAIDKVKHGTYTKQVILLISDGMENDSRTKAEEIHSLLKKENILLYALNPDTDKTLADLQSNQSQGVRALEKLTSITGGKMYWSDTTAEIRTNLERIALELHQQYSINIDGAKDASGSKWHPLKVKVTANSNDRRKTQKLTVRTRRGYYSKQNAKQ